MSGQIFISYRREESRWAARSLNDRLSTIFGPQQIFMDIDAIALGEDFVEAIETTVARCGVLIAVIGANWLTSKDDHGNPRLDNPEDFVRMEIATALKRKIRVIPVLFDGVLMPSATELPDDLKPLVRRNALRVSDASFDGDCQRLVAAIRLVLDKAAAEEQQREKERLDAKYREREENQRKEVERVEAQRIENDRLTNEQREQKRLEAERRQAEAKEGLEAEREKEEQERLETQHRDTEAKERLEAEQRERENQRLENERREKAAAEEQAREKSRLEAERRDRAEKQRQGSEGLAAQRIENERLANEQREKERLGSGQLQDESTSNGKTIPPSPAQSQDFTPAQSEAPASVESKDSTKQKLSAYAPLAGVVLLLIVGVIWFAGPKPNFNGRDAARVATTPESTPTPESTTTPESTPNPTPVVQPALARSLENSGNLAYYRGLYDEAIDDYTRAITADPKYGAAYQGRGEVYVKLGKGQKAKADFAKAQELSYTGSQ